MELALSAIAVFVFGAIIGSFLNVVIYRVPAGESVVTPGSHCPECGTHIHWYDNIPIVSWMLLGGQCRACGTSISIRYPMVEALTGMLAAMLWIKLASKPLSEDVPFTSLSPTGLFVIFGLYFTFIVLCIIIAFIDLDTVEIPFRFTITGIILGVASPFIVTQYITDPRLYLIEGGHWPPVLPMHSMIGAVLGGGAVLALIVIYFAARGVPGMGGGDVPLMAMVGAWLGWPAVIFIFFASSVQALIATGLVFAFGDGDAFLLDANELFEEENDDEGDGAHDTEEDAADHQPDEQPEDATPEVADDAHDVEEDGQPEEHPEDFSEGKQHEDFSEGEEQDLSEGEDQEDQVQYTEADLDELDARDAQEEDEEGLLAIPYGPFITLAAVEHLLFGDLLPSSISLAYLYTLI